MTGTHRSFGRFRVPEMLDLRLVGVPGGQCGFSFQRPCCPVLCDARSQLNITGYAFSIVTSSTRGNCERSRRYRRRVFPQPAHSSDVDGHRSRSVGKSRMQRANKRQSRGPPRTFMERQVTQTICRISFYTYQARQSGRCCSICEQLARSRAYSSLSEANNIIQQNIPLPAGKPELRAPERPSSVLSINWVETGLAYEVSTRLKLVATQNDPSP